MALLFLLAFVYLPFFLCSFLCPRHPHVLNVFLSGAGGICHAPWSVCSRWWDRSPQGFSRNSR